MKKILSVFIAAVAAGFLSVSFVCAGEQKEEKPLLSYEISMSGYSQYVGNISGGTFYDKAVIQSSFTVSHNSSGLYLNLWGSYSPRGGFNSDDGDEIDYTIGINRDAGPINLDYYYAYYNLVMLDWHGPEDVHTLGAKIKVPKAYGLNPYIAAEYYLSKSNSSDNGLAWRIGANFSPIEKLNGLIIDISVAGHTEMFGNKTEAVSSAKALVKYGIEFAKNIKLIPEVNFQKRIGYHDNEDGRGVTRDRIWGGATLTWTF